MFFIFQNWLKQLTAFCFLALFSMLVHAEQGLFWKAQSPDSKTIYLFGTIHTDDNRVTDFSPAVVHALKTSDLFMMETVAPKDNKAFMMKSGSLESMLTLNELEQVYALAEFHVMHRHAAVHMKPWLLAAIFDSAKPLTPFAQDNLLMTQAEDLGLPVIGIETTAEHFAVMDDLSQDEQLTMLRAVLKRTPEDKARDFERLMRVYLQGDAEKLAALNSQITGGMLPARLWEKMRVKLLDERNVVMLNRMVTEAKTKALFVAVGASHLAGHTGLIATLKQAGYQLSAVK